MVGRPTKAANARKQGLARARQVRLEARRASPRDDSSGTGAAENGQAGDESSGDDAECTGWKGGVLHYVSSDETTVASEGDSEELIELSGNEPEEVLEEELKTTGPTVQSNSEMNVSYSAIMHTRTMKDWRKVESHRQLGYNGQSKRTKRHHEQLAREKGKEDAKLRNR